MYSDILLLLYYLILLSTIRSMESFPIIYIFSQKVESKAAAWSFRICPESIFVFKMIKIREQLCTMAIQMHLGNSMLANAVYRHYKEIY